MRPSYWLGLSLLLIAFTSFGQSSFKKGYFIDKEGNQTVCFIKDSDWKNTPNSFDYKLDENGATQKMRTETIKEFAAGSTKYIRVDTKYDQSTQDLKKLGMSSSPEWVDANLLLRVVVEGKSASLYHYSTKDLSLFFFSSYGSPVEQLVYKSYMVHGDPPGVAANRTYITQLNSRVNCANNAPANDKQVPYILRPLATYFRNFNKCTGEAVAEAPKAAKAFSIRLTPGVDFSSVDLLRTYDNRNFEYGTKSSFRMGAEIELVLPFKNGKWTLVTEPNYLSYKSDKNGGFTYRLIEIPLGVRHRFFLSDKSYIFVNAMAFVDFPIEHTATFSSKQSYVSEMGAFGACGGAGYAFGRFSLEGRYYPWRYRSDAGAYKYHYTRGSLILGLRVF